MPSPVDTPNDPAFAGEREALAQCLWQEESVRAAGRRRLITFAEAGPGERARFLGYADAVRAFAASFSASAVEAERLARAMDALLTGMEASGGWEGDDGLYQEGHAALQAFWGTAPRVALPTAQGDIPTDIATDACGHIQAMEWFPNNVEALSEMHGFIQEAVLRALPTAQGVPVIAQEPGQ